jgi:hypothetical protein
LDIVQIDSPSAIAAIQKLDAQRQALRKGGWSKDPELKSQVSKLSDELYSQLLAEKQGAARQQKLLDESGLNWIIPDLINAASGGIDRTKRYIKEISRGINRFFNGGELDSLIDDLELADARNRGIRVETGGPSRSERFFEGYQDFNPLNWFSGEPKYNRAIPVARLARKGLRVLFAQQRKLARRFQNYPGIYNSNRDYEETRSMVNFDGQAELVKFFSLPSVKQERVGQFLQAARLEAASGNRFRETPDNLARLGLDEQEIQAYLDVRNYTNKSLGLMGKALKSDPPKWVTEEKIPQKQDALLGKWFEQVDNFIGGLINERYVPFSRFGKFAVWSQTANGGSGHLSFHESKESAKEQMKELVRQGARDVKGDIPIGRAAIEAYGYLPPALAFRLAQMDNFRDLDGRTPGSFNLNDIMPGLPPLAFNAHLVEAKLTPGWEKNIVKSLSDYNMGLATWVARKRTKIPFETALAGIDPIREKSLYDEAVRSRRRAQTPDYADKEISAVRKLFSLAYLSRPVTAMVNYLSRWTQTLPQLTKYIEDSPAAWYRMDKHLSNTANAYKQAWKVHRKAAKLESLFNRAFKEFKQNGGGKTVEMLRREYPEFFEATLEGVRRGIAGDEATQFFARKTTDHPNLDRMSDVLLSLFSGAEVATRKHAFITGYVLAKDFHNLQGDSLKSEAIRLGRQITLETQGDYSKANRPLVSTGYGALLTQFRLYSGFMLHEMRENMTPGQFKAAAGKLAIGLALGGVTTLPFYQQLEKMLQSMGFNPRLYVRKFMEKYFNSQTPADMAFYGTLGPLGVNISSSLAAGELAPGLESGGAAALGRTMLGVLPDPFQRVGRGYMYASEPGDENKVKAAEQWAISPTIRKLIQTGRYIVQGGKVTDKSGAVIAQLDPMDIAWTALGGTPMKEAKGYEDSYTMSLLEEQARKPNPIVKEIARARVKGDYGRASDLELEYFDKNKERVSPQAIKRAEEYIRDPYASRIKYAPKKVREELKGVRRRAGYE